MKFVDDEDNDNDLLLSAATTVATHSGESSVRKMKIKTSLTFR